MTRQHAGVERVLPQDPVELVLAEGEAALRWRGSRAAAANAMAASDASRAFSPATSNRTRCDGA